MGYYDNVLEHHGILGQKWGVRRFENEDGSLTSAGKARYHTDSEGNYQKLKTAKSNYKAASKNFYKSTSTKDSGNYYFRKKQLSDIKARIEMDGKEITKHQQKLIDKYKEKGMSQEEAEIAAYNRAKLEKTLVAAGAVTLAAAAAYGGVKYHNYVTDELLEVGKVSMKRITSDSTDDLHDTFYSAFGKHDSNKYVGLYGDQIRKNGRDVFQKTIDLKDNIKIASDKKAKDVMVKVLGDSSSEDRQEIINSIKRQKEFFGIMAGRNSKQYNILEKGIKDIESGNFNTKAAYDAININMTNGNQAKIIKEFKQTLKDAGYSGIKDRNDSSYSGYNAKTARIIFDTSKVKVSDIRSVSNNEITRKNGQIMLKLIGQQLIPQSIFAATSTAAGLAYKKFQANQTNNAAIQKYKREHPNTNLSNEQILENIYGR